MSGVAMANPRDTISDELNRQLNAFFDAGRTVQEVAKGVNDGIYGSGHGRKLRAEHDSLALQRAHEMMITIRLGFVSIQESTKLPKRQVTTQIGRASCRERVF